METMYQTGDYGKIVDGVLLYEGRTDSQIKVRGHRVDLTEVEAAIHRLPNSGIDKLAVLCYKPGETEQVYIFNIDIERNITRNAQMRLGRVGGVVNNAPVCYGCIMNVLRLC